MHQLLKLGLRIPEDVRMVGNQRREIRQLPSGAADGLHQPCQQIGNAAMAATLDRLENPTAPTRDVLLDCELIVRQSCGTQAG